MDGNGRWAAQRGMPREFGHRAGAETLRRVTDACRKRGIKYLTYYAFSTENWKRPKSEVDALMKLFSEYLNEVESFAGDKARIIFLGDKTAFPDFLREKMINLENNSKQYDNMTIMLAMNYGGRNEIVNAAKKLVSLSREGFISEENIDEKMFSELLYTSVAPDADLIIRTSGEQRLSNFLLWQSAYAELYFTDVLWPDFDGRELDRALSFFAKRNRRFGGV